MAEDIVETYGMHLERSASLTQVQFEGARRPLEPHYNLADLDPQMMATMMLALATSLHTSRHA
jgi:hypothetical protein